jgi:diacylglycerol kinase family enzyme
MSISKVVVLLNGAAGRGAVDPDRREAVEAACRAAGLDAQVTEVDPREMSSAIGAIWARDRPDAVVVAGGDGTVGCAAGAVAGTDVVLGVLPTGTFNHFAKDVGIPTDLEAAAEALVRGEVQRIDVAEVNGRVFVNNAVLGVYPEMVAVRDRLRSRHGWGKVRAVPVASMHVLRTFPVHRVDLTGPGGMVKRKLRTPLVFVGNGVYDNGPGGLPRRDSLTGGTLGVGYALADGRARLVRSALGSLLRGAEAEAEVDAVALPEVVVTSRSRRMRVALDGELTTLASPLRYRSRPGALRLVVPVPPEPEPYDDVDAEPFRDRVPDTDPDAPDAGAT